MIRGPQLGPMRFSVATMVYCLIEVGLTEGTEGMRKIKCGRCAPEDVVYNLCQTCRQEDVYILNANQRKDKIKNDLEVQMFLWLNTGLSTRRALWDGFWCRWNLYFSQWDHSMTHDNEGGRN